MMKYCVVDSCEWTYPDVHKYETEMYSVERHALRGGMVTFQIHMWNVSDVVNICAQNLDVSFYEQIPIPVEDNPNFEKEILLSSRLKKAPFLVNDCLRPWREQAEDREGSVGIYAVVAVPQDAAGMLQGEIRLSCGENTVRIPVAITVCDADLPRETLQIVMGYSPYNAAKWHGLLKQPDLADEMDTKYLQMLRRQHQTRLHIDPPEITDVSPGKYAFDFTNFNRRVHKGLAVGFTGFHISGVGFRRAWDSPVIGIRGMDALSYEAYVYLYQYLGALRENLRENGWLDRDMFFIGIADEPNEINALPYRAVCGMVRRIIPEIKIFDACSGAPIYGALDVWVPRSDEYEKNQAIFDSYKEMGDQVWHYVCLYPRDDGYINRFMDIPLLATRYLYWGNYKYGLTGYLHWAVNVYENDVDPFTASCPRHVNAGSASILPAGDDKLVYPGEGEPWMSMRLEAHRESAEEYEMLLAIAAKDKAAADALCARGFRSFHDVTYDGQEFCALREALLQTYERCCKE